MFKVYDSRYLASLLDITEREFHRNVKPIIVADFRVELRQNGIQNPDIGLDDLNNLYLVDPLDISNFIFTELNIESYLE